MTKAKSQFACDPRVIRDKIHVFLHPSSYTFFGFEWEGRYSVHTTLPFGWKTSAYIYHSISLAATSYIRSLGVPCVPCVYHSILMIGLTGSLDCVPLVHLLPFLGFSWSRWQRLLLVPFLFHCDISSGFKRVARSPPLPSVF